MRLLERTLVKSYVRSDTQWRNELNRALPILYVRWVDVDVYRLSVDFFGIFDKEVETFGEWQESALNVLP